jgi:hypothetical protein
VVLFAKGGREILAQGERAQREEVGALVDSVKVATRATGRKVVQARMVLESRARLVGTNLATTIGGLIAKEESDERSTRISGVPSAESVESVAAPVDEVSGWGLDGKDSLWLEAEAAWATRGTDDSLRATDVAKLLNSVADSTKQVCAQAQSTGEPASADELCPAWGLAIPPAVVTLLSHRWRLVFDISKDSKRMASCIVAALGAAKWFATIGQVRRAIAASKEASALATALAFPSGPTTAKASQRLKAAALAVQALQLLSGVHKEVGEVMEGDLAIKAAQTVATRAQRLKTTGADADIASAAPVAAVPVTVSEPVSASVVSTAELLSSVPAPSQASSEAEGGDADLSIASLVQDALAGRWGAVTRVLDRGLMTGDSRLRSLVKEADPSTGVTLLMTAAGAGRLDLVKRLVAAGVPVSARDKSHCSALWWGLSMGGALGWDCACHLASVLHPRCSLPAGSGAPGMSAEQFESLFPSTAPAVASEEVRDAFERWCKAPRA